MYCSECGNEIDENDKFCINCGEKNKTYIKNKSKINNPNFQFKCVNCGENVSKDDAYCPNCSEEFDGIVDDEDNPNFQFECVNCGENVSIDDSYCPDCSKEFDGIIDDEDNFYNSNQENTKNPKVIEVPNPSGTMNSSFSTFIKIICVTIIILLFFSIVQNPFYQNKFANNEKSTSEYNSEPAPEVISYITPATQTDKNIQIIEQIAKEYYSTHTYQDDDVFDCDNMAQDVWNMLKTKGINSKLMLGNVDLDKPITIEDANHVWVLAEVSPNNWLPIETTGGYVVYDNALYYRGYSFNNPKNYRSFIELYKDYLFQVADYENERNYYNQLVEQYNNADYYTQIQLKSALTVTENNVEIKERRALETFSKIEAILEYGS